MATHRKRDAAPLYELLKKSNYKVTKTPQETPPASVSPPTVLSGKSVQSPLISQNITTAAIPGVKSPVPPAASNVSASASAHVASAAATPSAGKSSSSAFIAAKSASHEPVLLDQITARLHPIFLFGGIALAILFVIALVIWLTGRSPSESSSNVQQQSVGTPGIDMNPQLEPMPSGQNQPQLPSIPVPSMHNNSPEQETNSQTIPGRVIPAIDVPRSPNLVYLVILTTQQVYAQRAADFLAEHGIDVTIERGLGNLVTVVSVQGFAKRSSPQANAFRHKVVEIGQLFPGAHRGQSVWGDAYFAPIHRND